MFAIVFHPDAANEMRTIRAFDRVRILEQITAQLTVRPDVEEGHKKVLDLRDEGFIWQLRVGTFRVFYDVDEDARVVTVRHVRRKGRKTTGEIL
jgi:mRNA-degrading endonuclease RelE of RelBE toxin-antitoxin system